MDDDILHIEDRFFEANKMHDEAFRRLYEAQNALDEAPDDRERQLAYQQAQQAYEIARIWYDHRLEDAQRAWQRLGLLTRKRLDVIDSLTGARVAEGAVYEDGIVVIAWPNGNETYPDVESLRLPFPLSTASSSDPPPLLIPRTRVLDALRTLGVNPKEAEQQANIIIDNKLELRLLEGVAQRREKGELP